MSFLTQRAEDEEIIKEAFTYLSFRADMDKTNRSSATANQAVNWLMNVLNLAYKGWSLVNLDDKKYNHPAIDLGCKKQKLGIQVSTVSSTEKINKSLKKLVSHNLQQDYPAFWMIALQPTVNTSGLIEHAQWSTIIAMPFIVCLY